MTRHTKHHEQERRAGYIPLRCSGFFGFLALFEVIESAERTHTQTLHVIAHPITAHTNHIYKILQTTYPPQKGMRAERDAPNKVDVVTRFGEQTESGHCFIAPVPTHVRVREVVVTDRLSAQTQHIIRSPPKNQTRS
jgi:hypothetical protein